MRSYDSTKLFFGISGEATIRFSLFAALIAVPAIFLLQLDNGSLINAFRTIAAIV